MERFYAHYSVIVPPDGDVKLFSNFCISLYSLAVDFWSHLIFYKIFESWGTKGQTQKQKDNSFNCLLKLLKRGNWNSSKQWEKKTTNHQIIEFEMKLVNIHHICDFKLNFKQKSTLNLQFVAKNVHFSHLNQNFPTKIYILWNFAVEQNII